MPTIKHPIDLNQLLKIGKSVIQEESQALAYLSQSLDASFENVCKELLHCSGKVIVMGMGKSGHIARKIAATFASTGTPSFYMHPSEALHGDIGMIEGNDVVVAISFSGESDEILMMAPYFKQHGIQWISITGNFQSQIAKLSNLHLHLPIEKEACPLGLAPTTSTTATLALGDALAVCLLHARGFTSHDFAKSHPSGSLGKKLLLRADDIAHYGDSLPIVHEQVSIAEAIVEMSSKRLGLAIITNQNDECVGIFTDGDLRRSLEKKHDIHLTPIGQVMHKNPATIPSECPLSHALALMNEKRITSLIVSKPNQILGLLHMHDILATGAFNES
jgi:arabinose-5-phosphate isomerase